MVRFEPVRTRFGDFQKSPNREPNRQPKSLNRTEPNRTVGSVQSVQVQWSGSEPNFGNTSLLPLCKAVGCALTSAPIVHTASHVVEQVMGPASVLDNEHNCSCRTKATLPFYLVKGVLSTLRLPLVATSILELHP